MYEHRDRVVILQGHNVRRRSKSRGRAGFYPQEMRELVPPLRQGGPLSSKALLHFGLGIETQWIVHVNQDLVEDH